MIERIVCQAFGMRNNNYLIYANGSKRCAVVDPAGSGAELLAALDARGLTPAQILLTHAHYDHLCGIPALEAKYGEIPIALHEAEAHWLGDPNLNLSAPMFAQPLALHDAAKTLADGAEFDACGEQIRVLHTPGHSPGSVCFLLGEQICTGDTIFRLGAGRSDTPGGDAQQLIQSIARLFDLPGDYALLPGHEAPSQLSLERKKNTFIKYYAPQLLRGEDSIAY